MVSYCRAKASCPDVGEISQEVLVAPHFREIYVLERWDGVECRDCGAFLQMSITYFRDAVKGKIFLISNF
ncbi:hypothetical protein J6590_076105 [Homalodisca vitripennis]|nr:hypothetical protein J6590_076105 [Homalodisca vitripennis]